MTIKVLLVNVDASHEVREIDGSLESLQGLVDGYIEHFTFKIGDAYVNGYCNEEGKVHGMDPNIGATSLAYLFGWASVYDDVLVGPVVFCGEDPGGDGDQDADVPQVLVDAYAELAS